MVGAIITGGMNSSGVINSCSEEDGLEKLISGMEIGKVTAVRVEGTDGASKVGNTNSSGSKSIATESGKLGIIRGIDEISVSSGVSIYTSGAFGGIGTNGMPSSEKLSSLIGGEIGITGTAIGNTGISLLAVFGADGIVGTTNSSCSKSLAIKSGNAEISGMLDCAATTETKIDFIIFK